ncbi:MAG: hypothetical protein J6R29_01715 [Clostridia bacterium]|nr:hypothetical protein [Clostridia bacterium]
MTVKDILITASTLLNRSDIKDFINGKAVENYNQVEEDFNLLLNCYNLVEEEISTDYFRLKDTQTFTVVDGVIKCQDFKNNVLTVLSVKNLNGSAVNAEIKPDGIYTNENKVEIEYTFVAPYKTLKDVSSFIYTPITKRAIAYGTITEYSLIKGDYEEAVTWHKKYINALTSSLSNKKIKKIKERKWL